MSKIGAKEKKIMLQMARKKLDSVKDIQLLQEANTKIETIPNGRPPAYETPEQLETVIEEYFAELETTKKHPTITGLALKLGIDRRTLLEYKKQDKFNPIINRAKQTILAYTENMLVDKGTFTPGQIFYLKNNYKQDYSDKVEVEHTGSISLVELNKRAMMLEEADVIEGEILEDELSNIPPNE